MRKFSIFNFKLSTQQGFTLIELLVVIGILGILASALVATIDPFEQLKKAQDANAKNTAVEFVNGMVRYYTTHNTLPWADTSAGANCQTFTTSTGLSATSVSLTAANMSECISSVIVDGELKTGFTTVTDVLKRIYASSQDKDSANNVVACFQPLSKSQAKDTNCKYNSRGLTDATFTGKNPATTSNLCFWCAL